MAAQTNKIKPFKTVEESKEFLLKINEENEQVSQNDFMDAISKLNLSDDDMDDLFNWCDEHDISFIDDGEDDVFDDEDAITDEEDEDSVSDDISELEKPLRILIMPKLMIPLKCT